MIAEFYFLKTTCMHSIYPVHAHPRVSFIVPINLFRQDASDFNGFFKNNISDDQEEKICIKQRAQYYFNPNLEETNGIIYPCNENCTR